MDVERRMTDGAHAALENFISDNFTTCHQCGVLYSNDEDDAETCECCERPYCPTCADKYGRRGARVRGEQLDADEWATDYADGWVCHHCQID